MSETMGHRLKQLRMARNLTQVELAALAGVNVHTLRSWEQDLKVPSLESAAKVAVALEISIDDMVDMPKRRGPRKLN
jgi:transcriptional regulator with XRE-family HTH domain